MAPPSSGGVAVLQILGLLERSGFERAAPLSAQAVHLFAEAGRLAYADRTRYLGDPAFTPVPVARLLDPAYLDARAKLIGERSVRFASPGDTEAPGTSHITIVDAEGNVASMTTTIESTFGSRIMVRGFLLNNQLTDFDFKPGSANETRPRKRRAAAWRDPRVAPAAKSVSQSVARRANISISGEAGGMVDGDRCTGRGGLPNFGSRMDDVIERACLERLKSESRRAITRCSSNL